MTNQKGDEVDAFLRGLRHGRKAEIEAIRSIIKDADRKIVERIKWNAPSYGYDDDRITFRLQPKDQVQLIFHRGARKRADAFTFPDETGILRFLDPDRAIVTFASLDDVQAKKARLAKLVQAWMKATS